MEFILQQQAKADAQIARTDAQIARVSEQHEKAEKRLAKNEKQIAAILKLIQAGMRMIVKQGENINQLKAHKQLADAQRTTEIKLQGLRDALRRGGNGHLPESS